MALAFKNAFAPPKGLNIVAVIVEDDDKRKGKKKRERAHRFLKDASVRKSE